MRSWMKRLVFLGLIAALGFWGFSLVWADEGPLLGPRTIVVALDGTGDFGTSPNRTRRPEQGHHR